MPNQFHRGQILVCPSGCSKILSNNENNTFTIPLIPVAMSTFLTVTLEVLPHVSLTYISGIVFFQSPPSATALSLVFKYS